MTNDDVLSAMNLTKPDIGKYVAGTAGGFSVVISFDGGRFAINTRAEFSEAIKKGEATNVYQSSFVANTCREFCESIKKGSTMNAARWICGREGYSLGFFRCSAFNFRPQASKTQAEKLAPGLSGFSRSTLSSMLSISSCGKRMCFKYERLFLFPVAIYMRFMLLVVHTPYSKSAKNKTLDVHTLTRIRYTHTLSTGKAQITKPGSASTLTGPLTTNDRTSIEAAMLDHTTHPQGRNTHTQTQPWFTYVFVAIRRTSPQLKHEQRRVTACTELEARKIFVRDFILVLASRIAAQAVSHG
ncbi:Uncharacterised protein [Serratia proteamaculans]|nr:Uncharacterised protein [Serratia proteamaculans]